MEILLFLLYTVIIATSTLGYGFYVSKYLNLRFNNIGLTGILGLFILSIISSYTHLFFSHNFLHNLIVISFGLLLLFKINKLKTSDLKLMLVALTLLIIFLFISKTNEDFGYYHLPNSLQFSHYKIQFGIGNLNHGFKHISSLFLLMSLNYLPVVEHYLFNLTNYLFYLFFLLFLYIEIFTEKNHKTNFSKILLSLFLLLFLTKFSRLAEFGSDIAGQIVVGFYIFFIFEALFNNRLNINRKIEYLSLASILIIFATTLKFILSIYGLLIIIVLILIKPKKKIFLDLVNFKLIALLISSFLIFIFLNFSATGCLIYPVKSLCFSNTFEWSLDKEVINYLNFHYELWSKAGRGPDFSVENPLIYLKNFNWFNHWLSQYFFGKFTDFLLVIFTILIVFYLFFIKYLSNDNIDNLSKRNFYLFYFTTIIIFLVWLSNFPTLRYAGYLISYLIIILPFIFFVNNKINLSKKLNLKIFFTIVMIAYSVFLFKNIVRLKNEIFLAKNLHHNFSDFPFYWVEKKVHKKFKINGYELYKVDGKCWDVRPTCVRAVSHFNIKIKNNYVFYTRVDEK
jgi:hypothetical protein